MDQTRRLALAFVAGVLAIGVACTNSGLGMTQDTSQDSEAPGNDDDDKKGSCAWAGEWALTKVHCGAFEITSTFETLYEGATLKIEAGDDGCEMVAIWDGGECRERERFLVQSGEGDLEFESLGVANCNPDGCTLPAKSTPCEQGDRAGASNVLVTRSDAETLSFTNFSNHAYPNCTIDFVTTWTKQ